MLKKIITLVALILVIFSCKKNDTPTVAIDEEIIEKCRESAQLGHFYLLENSKLFIPYPDTIKRVIFSDSTGKEYIGTITEFNTYNNSFKSTPRYCIHEPSIDIEYEWTDEAKTMEFQIQELDVKVSMTVETLLNTFNHSKKAIADIAYISIFKPITSESPQLTKLFTVDSRNYNSVQGHIQLSGNSILDTLILHNEIFIDVYDSPLFNEHGYQVYHSRHNGIVGIIKPNENLSIKFERIE